MTRYTQKALATDVAEMNEILSSHGHMIKVGSRNGYTAVDLAHLGGKVIRNIQCGTPRECLEYCNYLMSDYQ